MTGTVVVTSRSFSTGSLDVARRLTDAGYTVVTGSPTHDLSELAPQLARAVAWIAGAAPVTERHLDLGPQLRVVARYGVGYDAVDVDSAAARGVVVTNTPGANSESVAELALTLLLSSLRTVTAGDRAVRCGDWGVLRGREISSLVIGVAGFGRIGRAFARRVIALGGRVVVFDPFLDESAELPDGIALARDVSELALCDAVSLHAPGGHCIVTAEWLARAHGLALVNTARAGLVDEAALADALRTGAVASYAADTLDAEGRDPAASPLLHPDLAGRVTVTPHLGAQTVDAVDRMGAIAVENVLAALAGQDVANPVAPTTNTQRAPQRKGV